MIFKENGIVLFRVFMFDLIWSRNNCCQCFSMVSIFPSQTSGSSYDSNNIDILNGAWYLEPSHNCV